MTDATSVVWKIEEIIQNVKELKEESDGKSRNWAIVNTDLEKVLAYVKTYCVEEEE